MEAKRLNLARTVTTDMHDTEKPQSSFPITSTTTMGLDTQAMIDHWFGSKGNYCEIVEYPQNSEKRYFLYCHEHKFNPTLYGPPEQTQLSSLDRAIEHLQKEHESV